MAWVLVFLCTQCTFLDFLVSFPTSSPCYGWLLLPSVSSHCMSHVPFLLFPPLLCVLSDLCFTCPVKFPAPVITRLCSNVLHQRIIVSPRLFWIEAPVSSLPFLFFCFCHIISSLVRILFFSPSPFVVSPRDHCGLGWMTILCVLTSCFSPSDLDSAAGVWLCADLIASPFLIF